MSNRRLLRNIAVSASLADDAPFSQLQWNQHFLRALEFLGQANVLDALRTIVAKEKAVYKASHNNESALRVALTEQAILNRRVVDILQSVANRADDEKLSRRDPPKLTQDEESTLNLLEAKLIAKVKRQEIPFQPTDAVASWPTFARSYLNAFEDLAPRLFRSFKKKLRDVLSASDEAESREIAERLSAEIRRDELPGQELPLEGVLADGTELDWASYRGKVVWLQARYHFKTTTPFALPNDAPQITKYKGLYAKYADAGLAVLEYDVDLKAPNADDLEKLLKERFPNVK